ncbi:MAG: hypothetical protein KF729_30500 [Sandaracinaceae bacterium]|nr:hypothetical protein [Sandaracinaceae bacterium]
MSAGERLFALVPLGGGTLLLDAAEVRELAPLASALASEWPSFDLCRALALDAPAAPHALLYASPRGPRWLLVEPGTRFERLATRAVPAWLAGSRIRALAPVENGFGLELDLDTLLASAERGGG